MTNLRYILAVSAFVLAASCGGTSTPTAPSTGTSTSGGVTISGGGFSPASMTVSAGTTVTWTNTDAIAHTATSDGGVFDSGSIAPGGKYSYTFAAKGTFPYHCTIHPHMIGSVIVQ